MSILLNKLSGSATSTTASEIPAFDPASDRLYVVAASKVDVYSVSNTGALTSAGTLSPGFTPASGVAAPNSIAIKNGIVAVAYEIKEALATNLRGRVSFFRASDGNFLNSVEVGFLPDMLTFTPDGTKVLVANEGEPNENYTVDPEGSVSVITINSVDLTNGTLNATVQEANFNSFDSQIATLKASGVRIIGDRIISGSPVLTTVSQDVEPEYIAVAPDGLTAKVTLQEANAIATLDIASATITGITPLGLKNFNLAGNGIDASDRDVNGTSAGGGKINIKNWPVFGAYQPDAIASYTANGQTYYVIANEGDSRVRPTAAGIISGTGEGGVFNEETRVASLNLDTTLFPNAADLKKPENLGRLTVTNKSGDTDGDGDFDQIVAFGGRSFSILDSTGRIVFDSGDQLEQITAKFAPTLFNSDGTTGTFDTRSDNKGPEPEGVTTGVINGRTYAFIGLERVGDVIVYDVTDPIKPSFVQYLNTPEDRSVEGVTFVSAGDSPTGKSLVITASEVSNTVSVFESTPTFKLQILHASDFEAGIPAVDDAVRFSAIVNKLKDDPNYKANTLILSSGDNYIPGAFLNASSDRSLDGVGGLPVTPTANNAQPVIGRGDIGILNAIGIQASALGNHEFDLGVRQVRDIIRTGSGNPGTAFPYLSTNLNFQPEITAGNLGSSDLATNQTTAEANSIKGKLAKSTVITVAGNDGIAGNTDDQKIGIVGATTPTLPNITSSGSIIVTPNNPTDYAALAAEIQATVDILKAQGINKIVLLSHFQQFAIERDEIAPRLRDVDIIIGGGSNTLLADENDILRAGDTKAGDYPIIKTGIDGKPILVVNTDGNYKYVGRLVTEFDENGVLLVDRLDNKINGAYATDEAGVDRVYGADVNPRDVANPNVVAITDGIRNVISSKDNLIVGKANVFLNGNRGDVRTQETNLGNLSADANLALARQIDPTVLISIKNGGGIRDNIGAVAAASGAVNESDVVKLPTQPNPLAPNKKEGDISQLDIENSLRFNNDLSLVTVTAQQLRWVIEHAVAGTAAGATPGQFPQISGLSFSFDATKKAIAFNSTTGEVTTEGERVRNLVVLNEDGSLRDTIVKDGVLVGNSDRTFRLVTLSFLAGTSSTNALGGDNYPFPAFVKKNATLANRVDLRGETIDLNGNGKVDTALNLNAGKFTFAAAGSEQDALAEYLAGQFSTTAYNLTDVGASKDTRIQNLSVRNDGVLSKSSLTQISTGVIGFTGDNALTQLSFKINSINSSTTVNELVVFEVDGSTVNLKQLLETGKGRVVSSILSNQPNGFSSEPRILGFAPNAKLGFALIKNGTADQVLAGQSKEIVFSTSTSNFISNVTTDSFKISFEGLVVDVTTSNVVRSLGVSLQDNQQGEAIDLRDLAGKINANFTVNREAAFNNFVGFYRVADINGGIDTNNDGVADILPGQSGYTLAAVQRRVAAIDLTVTNQGTAQFNGKELIGGSIFAPFIISNATVDQVLSGQSNQVYFSYLGANSDGVDHIRLLGDNTFGFEDLPSGGDLDYNDIIVKVKLG
ncbi:choice-of-anchor I family protein [Pseudanabaena sp. FACHB-1998]|uniref:choice-of-anchor I family protein n=1 Tax=Pseudanabaena sp. FACHB-1998 TaxID=2692858 RepID=UPI0016817269|nr:choice-of-anchor I family protein [Pseudanabaena sp. FACHB-1998]MBD2175752.1 choice-of-anchor I family protein [Pseudanabaena sp. FACHB-1998]